MLSRIIQIALCALLLTGAALQPVAAHPCIDFAEVDCWEWWIEDRQSSAARATIVTYTVQAGDTLWEIAARYDLDVDTLRYSNPDLLRNPDLLSIDQEVRILPFIGAIHQVRPGETLAQIAARWQVEPQALLHLDGSAIEEGQVQAGEEVIVPGGYLELQIPAPAPALDSPFAWPLRGRLTQRFEGLHRGVDIATSYGAPVYAAGEGVVARAGWLFTGYGYSVLIRHGQGWETLYSHLKGPSVQVGQRVSRGQVIGAVGSTGRSTGPHVHFEVRRNGVVVDPLPFLPPLPPQ
ncbi:MAG: M23 family metallopeptidase [Caldilineales bacterium]|nr:M23 family metallopeptidase [Caldilineales bacterium]